MVRDVNKEFDKLLNKHTKKFNKAIKIDWGVGSAINITNAKLSGRNTTAKPLSISQKDLRANTDIIKSLVKGVNDELAKKINYLVNKNISERGSNQELAKELKGIFEKDNPNYFNYKNRFKTIAFNESNRILNTSSFNTAKKIGAKKKYLGQGRANPWPDSLIALDKYGSEEKAIPLDEYFEFTYNGKKQRYLFPPGRVNDSEFVFFTFE